MKIAIMQPYFFPYIGYFQLMNAVDEFVLYDNIQYTKKGWINRNRILANGKDSYITIPLRKDSDFLDIRDRYIAASWDTERKKVLNRISEAYRKAPCFDTVYPLLEGCMNFGETNLFAFILNSLHAIKRYLKIETPFVISSTLPIDHALKGDRKVIAICKERNADTYWNPIGGIQLYSRETFAAHGISLHFLKANEVPYNQFTNEFVPFLSIADVMMFNDRNSIIQMLPSYILHPPTTEGEGSGAEMNRAGGAELHL